MKKVTRLQFIGFIFTVICGVLLHFAYEWSGNSNFWAMFSGVNESTWEHMKLLFFPMFIFSLIENVFLEEKYHNFWCVKFIGITSGIIMIPVIFYTFNGVLGTTPSCVNISIFAVSAGFTYWLETRLFSRETKLCREPQYALLMLFILSIVFVLFTYAPPHLPLFQDPTTKGYGINVN